MKIPCKNKYIKFNNLKLELKQLIQKKKIIIDSSKMNIDTIS